MLLKLNLSDSKKQSIYFRVFPFQIEMSNINLITEYIFIVRTDTLSEMKTFLRHRPTSEVISKKYLKHKNI